MTRLTQLFFAFVLAVYATLESYIAVLKWLVGIRTFKTTVASSSTNRAIISKCATLLDFRPVVWGQGALLQLYLAIMCPAPRIHYHRKTLTMEDGGTVVLDWSEDPDGSPCAPTLIILHGIAGNSNERYVRRMASTMKAHGWHVVVYNRRGHALAARAKAKAKALSRGQTPSVPPSRSEQQFNRLDAQLHEKPSTAQPQSTTKTWALYCDVCDMVQVVAEVRRRRPQSSGYYAVGFSAGSNCLVRYLGELGDQCKLDAAVSVANGYDLTQGVPYIEQRAPLMSRMITLNLLRMFKSCETEIETHSPKQVLKKDVKKAKTIRQLDHAVTLKLYNLKDIDSYYRDSSCINVMQHVSIPLLCLNALDDPLIDEALGRMGDKFAAENSNIISILTSHGGHLGWVQGWRKQWMSTAISEFFLAVHAALQNHEVHNVDELGQSPSDVSEDGNAFITCAA